jgi:iron complex transport system substrate-binding protein
VAAAEETVNRTRLADRRSLAGLPTRLAWGVGLLTLTLAATLAAGASQDAPPTRIISVVPAVTEVLFAIGAGPQVVGVSSFDTYPPEVRSRPTVGALLDPDFERILALKPDLVVVYGTQSDLADRLRRARIPMFTYQHAGLADVWTTITKLGARVGRASDASALVRSIERDLDQIRARVSGRPRPRVALLFGREPGALRNMFVSGGIGFLHDLIELVGGVNVFADVARESLQASSELMLARAPDVIIETRPSSWRGDAARERAVWQGLPVLPAVRSGRVHIVADDRLFIPGPRVADAARLLADLIHPGAAQN